MSGRPILVDLSLSVKSRVLRRGLKSNMEGKNITIEGHRESNTEHVDNGFSTRDIGKWTGALELISKYYFPSYV